MTRRHYSTETPWETFVGYSRAVKAGNQIFVSGTTASDIDGSAVCVQDAAGQTRFILMKIESALVALGASLNDVVRTRMFVVDINQWEKIGAVHREFLADVCPAATMVEVSRLTHPDHLVEIEVDALLDGD
ncbi:MAG: RidA family protein [Planctomycetaceae bacterium]